MVDPYQPSTFVEVHSRVRGIQRFSKWMKETITEQKKKKNVDSIKNDTKWELRIYMTILPKQN